MNATLRDHVSALDRRAVLTTGIAAVGLTIVLSAVVLPGLVTMLPGLPTAVQLLVLILVSSAGRVAAGLVGGRVFRARHGVADRRSGLVSVALGGALGWLALLALTLLAVGMPTAAAGALLLALLRWLAECMLGGWRVSPGGAGSPRRGYYEEAT